MARGALETLMTKEIIFTEVFNILLDYADSVLKEKCAKWRLGAFDCVERQGKVATTANINEHGVWFMYAVVTAFIVGEFGRQAFGNYFSDRQEIELNELGLRFEEVEGWLGDEVGSERREVLRQGNFITLEDVWDTIQEFKREIFQALFAMHVESGAKHPADAVFASLVAVFEETNTDGTVMSPFHDKAQEMSTYLYVTNAFHY